MQKLDLKLRSDTINPEENQLPRKILESDTQPYALST